MTTQNVPEDAGQREDQTPETFPVLVGSPSSGETVKKIPSEQRGGTLELKTFSAPLGNFAIKQEQSEVKSVSHLW